MGSTLSDGSPQEPLCQIVTPVGMLGYGFNADELYRGLDLAKQTWPDVPTAIILDSGSTDSGPSKLALGSMTCPRSSYTRDLHAIIKAVRTYGVPLLLSSAGGDGADEHVQEFVQIVSEILEQEKNLKLKVLAIYSDIEHSLVLDRLAAKRIAGCGPCVPLLTPEDVQATRTIVGQMGPEPFVQAMAAHPDFDIVIGGRAYDPSPYVAFSAHCAFQKQQHIEQTVLSLDPKVLGGFTHMGKIMECGGLCATPKSKASMATVYRDGSFDIRPLATDAVCVPLSVAAHTLYEKSRPDKLAGPGGDLDLTRAVYSSLPDGVSVHVSGSVFYPSWNNMNEDGSRSSYTVKLEGARQTGYRTIFMGSFCDPILIPQLSDALALVKQYVTQQHQDVDRSAWQLDFHIYDGKDHEYGPAAASQSTASSAQPDVVFIVGEALADTQALANSIASAARIGCAHGPYKGQKANSGNFGMGIGGKMEIEMGPCAEFSLYHVMSLAKGEEGASELPPGQSRKTTGAAHVPGSPLFQWQMSWSGEGNRAAAHAAASRTSGLPLPVVTPPTAAVDTPNGANETNGAVRDRNSVNSSGNTGKGVDGASKGSSGRHGIGAPAHTTFQTLGDLAKIIRSKNSGPYEITLDVLFDDPATYKRVKATGVLTPQCVSDLYGIPIDQIMYCGFFDQALAFKATLPRMRNGKLAASGGFMENDVHGSQKHKPLLGLKMDL